MQILVKTREKMQFKSKKLLWLIFLSAHVQCVIEKVAETFLMKKQQKVIVWNLALKKYHLKGVVVKVKPSLGNLDQ